MASACRLSISRKGAKCQGSLAAPFGFSGLRCTSPGGSDRRLLKWYVYRNDPDKFSRSSTRLWPASNTALGQVPGPADHRGAAGTVAGLTHDFPFLSIMNVLRWCGAA